MYSSSTDNTVDEQWLSDQGYSTKCNFKKFKKDKHNYTEQKYNVINHLTIIVTTVLRNYVVWHKQDWSFIIKDIWLQSIKAKSYFVLRKPSSFTCIGLRSISHLN